MGVKEAYAKKMEAQLEKINFDLKSLKKTVDTKGLGNMPEWLNTFHELSDRIDETKFHINYFRRKREPEPLHVAKLHIASLMEELASELRDAENRYGR